MDEAITVHPGQFALDRLRQPGHELGIIQNLMMGSEAIESWYHINEIRGEGNQLLGYEINLGQNEPGYDGNDWVLFDFDDTLVQYSAAKGPRQKEYETYLTDTGLAQVESDYARHVMDLTDEFARWEDQGKVMYHIEAHMQALAWATNQLRGVDFNDPAAPDSTLLSIRASLARMAATREDSGEPLEGSDPFILQDGILTGNPAVAREESIERVFVPMLKPKPNDDVIESMYKLNEITADSGVTPNIGIFTYGDPVFQMAKTLALMEEAKRNGRPLPVSRILLTSVPKDTFMGEMAYRAGWSGENRSEYFNSIGPHSILLVDDNPEDLTGFEQLNHYVMYRSTTAMAALRIGNNPLASRSQRPWEDTTGRTQFFPRATYRTNDAVRLTESILEVLHMSRLELTEATYYQHPVYVNDIDPSGRYHRQPSS